ncbi:phage tail protein [Lactiplantibacillus plantarum]
MSVIEKQSNVSQFAGLTSQYNVILQNAKDDGIDTTAVTTAYNNLNRFMADILADPDNASDVDRVTYKKYQDAYNEELSNLKIALQNNTNNKFTSAANATSQAASVASQAFSQAQSAVDYASSGIAVQYEATQKAQSAASEAVSKAESTASEFGKVSQKTDSAFDNAMSAQNAASSAVATAHSTASEFGNVSQKADSAVASALNAQSSASDAVKQASSAAADSKDAKQIAGAVSQSYKTLTDESTMTIAELESGLAVKLTKTDLDGYATETWAQNQINATADGINATLSSVKTTVDGQTTSINDLKADSSSFKSQFTTVNDTLGKQTTDIGNLQATSKELSSNFSSLNADNSTNKSDISELKQTATEVSSTLETVKTQVQNSAVGANLIVQSEFKNGYLDPSTGGVLGSTVDFHSDNYIATNGATVFTFSSPDYTFKGNGADDRIAMYDSNKNYLGYQSLASPTQTLSNSNVAYIRFCINSGDEGNTTGNSSDWLANHRYKLEKGSVATDYSVNPADTATQSQITQLSSDINLRVKKDGLISQINLQAKNTLISSGGQLTLAGDTVYFDTDKPVIIPSANIETVLVRKQLQAADISANTFTTNNGTFTVKQDGSITAKNMTLTGCTLTSPTINASTINGSTINGTTFHGGDIISNANNTTKYYPMTITPDGAYKSTYFDSTVGLQSSVESGAIIYKYRSMIGNGKYLAYDSVINGQGLNLQSGYTSAKDTTFSNPVSTTTGYVIVNANDGITLHGDNQQITFNGTSADTTPKGIIITPYGNINPNGTQNIWYVGNNMNMKTASFGMDGSGTYNIQFNRSLDIGNFNINTYHTITSTDNGPIHFNRNDGKSVDIYAATVNYTSLVKSSLLSLKKGVEKADTAYWAQLVNSIDLATYQYKSDDNMAHIRLSSIVDDVNDTKQWRLPDIFINRDENGKLNGVDDSVLLNATLATVQEQQKEIDQLNGHNMQLEARLNKLEAKLNG